MQKFRLYSPILFLLVLLFGACKAKSNEEDYSNNLIITLSNSSEVINHQNNMLFADLEKKTTDIRFQEAAEMWEPKAKLIKHFSDNLVKFLEILKVNYSSERNDKLLKALDESLILYGQYLKTFNRNGENIFRDQNLIFRSIYETDKNHSLQSYINRFSKESQLVTLFQLQNCIRTLENTVLSYCNNHMSYIDDSFHSDFSIILSQNSKHLTAGDFLEINAGIGAFSTAASARMTIDSKEILAEENGIITYKFKTSLDTGRHVIPVIISFLKPDGSKGWQKLNITYFTSINK